MSKQVWTQTLIIDIIRELSERRKSLSHGSMADTNPRLVYAAGRYFGSWGAALAAAGVDLAQIRSMSKASRAEKITKWSVESIVDQLRELASRGERMTGLSMRLKYPSLYYAAVSERYFGSWSAAIKAAGVEPNRTRISTSATDAWHGKLLLDRILELKRQYGDLPDELARNLCPEILEAAERRFGDWNRAVELADSGGQSAA
ncbi:MAG: hypothetical protein Q7T82_15895 [Armatimonadota bacterium]|nr:hypothetical protein [Armatimonadota bacterium]